MASLSVDLDDLWTYLKARGDPTWNDCPSFLGSFVPIVLELFDRYSLKTTFFIVGRDAAQPAHRDVLQSIPAHGHEVANHSYSHDPWLECYSELQIEDELTQAERAIRSATGQHPIGFRAPAFSWNAILLEVLARRGYMYDASLLPTYIGPIARRYYLRDSSLTPEQRAKLSTLYGPVSNGLRPTKPFVWTLRHDLSIIELPVTTLPVAKVPFHFSYLLYLACFSESLMRAYFRTALEACRLTGTQPSFLLHPLDLLGGDLVPQLSFLPWMRIRTARKQDIAAKLFSEIVDRFPLETMRHHASLVRADPRTRSVRAT